ncbi:MAG: hypothetical protein AAGF51_01830 [Pseudomonadota bacterium]
MAGPQAYLVFNGFELFGAIALAAVLVVLCVRGGALGDNRRLFQSDEEFF